MNITLEFEKRNCLRKELSKISYLGGIGDSVDHVLMNLTKLSNRFMISDCSLRGVT